MNKSWRGALGVKKLNSATALIQIQPRRVPHGKYVLHRLGSSQENDQLLREGRTPQRVTQFFPPKRLPGDLKPVRQVFCNLAGSRSATERSLAVNPSEDHFKTACRNRKCFCAHTYWISRAAKGCRRKVDLTDQLSGLHGDAPL